MSKIESKQSETYADRVREDRHDMFTVISAEEDAEIARRTGRARTVERCAKCGRSYRITTGCWWCRTA